MKSSVKLEKQGLEATRMTEWKDKAEKAKKAKKKKAPFGKDLDLSVYHRETKEWENTPLHKLPEDIKKKALLIGVRHDEMQRCGSYFQLDHSVMLESIKEQFEGKIEIMSMKKAIKKYDWIRNYWWKMVSVDMDKYTAQAELEWDNGYFMRALPNQKVVFPLQACLFISQEGISQNVHNLIIAEEGSDVQIITGCTSSARGGLHIGVSEFYIKKNAKLTFTMIHRWTPEVDVRPRAVAVVEENATFTNNYICLNPLKSLQLYPTIKCIGKNSSASLNTIVLSANDAEIDVGGRIMLRGKNSSGHIVSRVVGTDSSKTFARAQIIGENEGKAHIDCRGLIISESAEIHAVPMLDGLSKDCELSHEAAVGKIKEEELWYLMSRGLNEEEAISLIIKGYLNPGIFGLPVELEKEIKKVVDITTKEAM
jgi:hypothetical protein